MSTPQGSWNFGWPVAIATVAVVSGVTVLAAMGKLQEIELFGVRLITSSSPQSSSLPPPAIEGSIDQTSIQPTSTPPTQVGIIPSPTPSQTSEKTGVVNAADGAANLRSSASAENKLNIQTTVPNGTSVVILEELRNNSNQIWYKVQVGGQTGWMSKNILRVN